MEGSEVVLRIANKQVRIFNSKDAPLSFGSANYKFTPDGKTPHLTIAPKGFVSRYHCTFSYDAKDGRWIVFDGLIDGEQSKNGIIVNGRKATSKFKALLSGDIVSIFPGVGNDSIEFQVKSGDSISHLEKTRTFDSSEVEASLNQLNELCQAIQSNQGCMIERLDELEGIVVGANQDLASRKDFDRLRAQQSGETRKMGFIMIILVLSITGAGYLISSANPQSKKVYQDISFSSLVLVAGGCFFALSRGRDKKEKAD